MSSKLKTFLSWDHWEDTLSCLFPACFASLFLSLIRRQQSLNRIWVVPIPREHSRREMSKFVSDKERLHLDPGELSVITGGKAFSLDISSCEHDSKSES